MGSWTYTYLRSQALRQLYFSRVLRYTEFISHEIFYFVIFTTRLFSSCLSSIRHQCKRKKVVDGYPGKPVYNLARLLFWPVYISRELFLPCPLQFFSSLSTFSQLCKFSFQSYVS